MITSHFDDDLVVMIHTGIDQITLDDVLQATKKWFSQEQFDPHTPVVWDMGVCRIEMSVEEMREMYLLIRGAVSTKRAGGRTSWVHSSAMVRAMIKLVFQEFDWGSEWETFQSLDEAIAWSRGK